MAGRFLGKDSVRPFALYLYGPSGGPLDTSFEQASERLQQLERLYFEPDGSFTWVVQPGSPQQVDGMLYDARGQVQYVDIKGACSLTAWRRLSGAICPASELCVLRLSDGVLQQLQQFERETWEPPCQSGK